jgi:phage shock protein E
MSLSDMIKKGTIVDVRTPAEFSEGKVDGAINIPLKEIRQKIEEIKKLRTPIVLCCASGNRSGQAHEFLSTHGVECVNGGSWLSLIKTN